MSSIQLDGIVSYRSCPSQPPCAIPWISKARAHGTSDCWLGQRPPGRHDLQRIAAGDARCRRRSLAVVSHVGAGGDRRFARRGLPVRAPSGTARAQRHGRARRCSARRGHRLSAPDSPCASAHHCGSLDRPHRPSAARDRDLRRSSGRRTAETAILAVLDSRRRDRRRIRAFSKRRWSDRGRSPDARRHRALRARLRRRRDALAPARWLAGHLLGLVAGVADDGGDCAVLDAGHLERCRRAGMVQPGLRLDLQHAGGVHLLVSRPCPWRHRRGRSVTAPATLFRTYAGGRAPARADRLDHDRLDRRCRRLRGGRAKRFA